MRNFRITRPKWIAATILSTFWLSSAYALPIDPGGGGSGPPGQQHALACIENATVSFTASPPTVDLGGSTTLSWSIQLPPNCSVVGPTRLSGQPVNKSGTKTPDNGNAPC